MRTWHIDLIPYLCNKHLIGMHGELHKHRHIFVKKYKIDGRINPVVQIEPGRMGLLHKAVVKEMGVRGMEHKSEYKQPNISYLPKWQLEARVSFSENVLTLKKRCKECGDRMGK